jgi:serine/threonine protein kinase
MQLLQGGSFCQFLESVGGKLTENEARFFFRQILEGIRFIHDHDYAHRNINFDSLLLTKDLTVKLTNFGHAKVHSKLNSF